MHLSLIYGTIRVCMTESDNPGRVFSFGEELESPLAQLESIAGQLRTDEEEKTRRSLTIPYKNLGRELIVARLKGAAVGNGLKGRGQRMDLNLIQDHPEFVIECLESFAQGTGINLDDRYENLPHKQLNYLIRIPSSDPYICFLDSFRDGRVFTHAVGLFIKSRVDLETKERLADLGEFISRNENYHRIERNMRPLSVNLGIGDTILPPIQKEKFSRIVEAGLPLKSVISLHAFLPVYGEWMVQVYKSITHP